MKKLSDSADKQGVVILLGLLILFSGCASKVGVKPVNIHEHFKLLDRSALTASEPSERTLLFLRQHDMADQWKRNPEELLRRLALGTDRNPGRESLFALMELSYIRARKKDPESEQAMQLYLSCAMYAYNYLFDPRLGQPVTPYDLHSRLVCEFYNRSIGSMVLHFRSKKMRVQKGARLPSLSGTVEIKEKNTELTWKPEEYNTYYITYEFRVKGLSNHHMQFGLGVPLVIVRITEPNAERSVREKFLPKFRQTYGATLLVGFEPFMSQTGEKRQTYRAELNIYDTINTSHVRIHDQTVPLESDFTTPLAYMIEETPLPEGIKGLFDAEAWKEITGMHMLQPYKPGKIPVVFVHGLMSSPSTWLAMFNNLIGDPELRKRCQFWFFMYPTGSPVLYSANTLRKSLLELQHLYDPEGTDPAFNQMVLIGHSMGGLLSKIMVKDGGDRLWEVVSDIPLSELGLPPEKRSALERMFYFKPLPFIRREIFICTPHRGSELADLSISRFGSSLVKLPGKILDTGAEIFKAVAMKPIRVIAGDRGLKLDSIPTSIDNLSPGNPFLNVLAEIPFAPGVTFHSIIGNHEAADTPGGTDMVVPYESAHLEGVASEKIVQADHSAHNHPLAVLEVRRILSEHIKKADSM
ncbi:alpha/beta fold hydrolase [Desulfococcaceae bacterium HSG8]|nr:alpha/beta fold hydrolase [Desulfococcaceae bacterium HSG8]